MKKKRKIFIVDLSIIIEIIIVIFALIGFVCFCTYYLCTYQELIGVFIGLLVIFLILTLLLIIIFFKILLQWIIVDEDKIIVRNIFGIIQENIWANVERIQVVPIKIHDGRLVGHCFMFIDKCGGKVWVKSLLNRKGEYIKIEASKRTREFLLQLKPDLKFTEYHGA